MTNPIIELPNGHLVKVYAQLFCCGTCGFSFDAAHCDEQRDVPSDPRDGPPEPIWTCPLCYPEIILPLSPEANSDA